MVRCPPTNDVVPLSPVIVYRLLFSYLHFWVLTVISFEKFATGFGIRYDVVKIRPVVSQEIFFAQQFYLLSQWVEQALCVTDDNGFVVCAEHFCREGVEKFVDSPYSAGKGHEYVASLDEQPFTFTHAVGCDEVGGLLTGSTHFGDMPGDNAEYLASIVADFLSDNFHEASVGSSVY